MASCATGPCSDSTQTGGDGCHLCDVVAPGHVTYSVPARHHGAGHIVVTMASFGSAKDGTTKREAKLTSVQAAKAVKSNSRKSKR